MSHSPESSLDGVFSNSTPSDLPNHVVVPGEEGTNPQTSAHSPAQPTVTIQSEVSSSLKVNPEAGVDRHVATLPATEESLREDDQSWPPIVVAGQILPGVSVVPFDLVVLSPIDRLAEAHGFFFEEGRYKGFNPIETGATQDGFKIFPEGNAYDHKLGKAYTRQQMAEFAHQQGFGHDFTVHPDHAVRRKTTLDNTGSKTQKPFNWGRATTWDYHDEQGQLLFQVGRIDNDGEKQIRQRRLDGQGGWSYNLDGVRRVLYRLPQVIRANTVIVVEGERAAQATNDRLLSEGLLGPCIATTASGGAANPHLTPLEGVLAGKTVAVLPDNDAPGARYADYFCNACAETSPVKRVELPGLPDKGDIVDFFEAGGTLEQVLQLVDQAPRWEPAVSPVLNGAPMPEAPTSAPRAFTKAPPPSEPRNVSEHAQTPPSLEEEQVIGPTAPARRPRFVFQTLEERLALPEAQWLVEKMLKKGTTSLLTGKHASCKSFIALGFALSIATNRSWYGLPVEAGAVIYIAAEGADGVTKRAITWLAHKGVQGIPSTFRVYGGPIPMADDQVVTDLIADLKALNPAFIVIDTLARCALDLDENSVKDMGRFINGVDRVVKATGAHALIVHHNNKSGSARGSSSLPAAVDTHLSVDRCSDIVTLSTEKQKDAEELAPLTFEIEAVTIPHPRCEEEDVQSIVLNRVDKEPAGDATRLRPLDLRTLECLIEDFGSNGATQAQWICACKKRGLSVGNFRRSRRNLMRLLIVKDENGKVVTETDHKKAMFYPDFGSDVVKSIATSDDALLASALATDGHNAIINDLPTEGNAPLETGLDLHPEKELNVSSSEEEEWQNSVSQFLSQQQLRTESTQ